MQIDKDNERFLLGKSISNAMYFTIKREPLYSRNEVLIRMVKNKNVLHLGCADHISLIQTKRRRGTYLHDLLTQSAKKVIGADINSNAIEEMNRLGINEVYHVSDIPNDISFDFLLVPDVIEHVGNIDNFLNGLRDYGIEKIIVTTPNAYRLENRLAFKKELVNTDHRYWFSPYTLVKSIYACKYKLVQLFYTDIISFKKPFSSLIKFYFPLCRDGLVAVISDGTENQVV
jgi:hypothetical protein